MIDLCEKNRKNDLLKTLNLQELTPLERYAQDPESWRFREIPKRQQTPDLVKFAVSQDGLCLRSVSKKLITSDLCSLAVSQNGCALNYVPEKYLSQELCICAVKNSGCAIEYVPEKYLSQELCICAVKNSERAIRYVPEEFITDEVAKIAVCHTVEIRYEWENAPIAYVPYPFLTAELAMLSVQHCPRSLKNIYQKYMSKKLLQEALSRDGTALEYVPQKKMTQDLIELAVSNNPSAWEFVPESKKTDTLRQQLEVTVPDSSANEELVNGNSTAEELPALPAADVIDEEIKEPASFSLTPITVDTPRDIEGDFQKISRHNCRMLCHFGADDDRTLVPVYYISDIHLEHQLQPIVHGGITVPEIEHFIDDNIKSMVKGIDTNNSVLLVAGDVADSIELARLFYCCLRKSWHGRIFGVLGNHELWDGHPEGSSDTYTPRHVDEIIKDYCDREQYRKMRIAPPCILQNALYIYYKNQTSRILPEKLILNASSQDLSELCSKSTMIILGGIGFSGRNQHYNAELGLYRGAVQSNEADLEYSNRFLALYKKLRECAGNQRVIVLTHTPVSDWSDQPYNPNWIYVNGHTHVNAIIRKPDGTTVLSDNQIGYTPHKWKLYGFTVSGWYDPFLTYRDGIYPITAEQYVDFNAGRGIACNGCNYEGDIYVLKKDGVYLFLLKGKTSLCLLEGGRRHHLENGNIQYYYDHMTEYHHKVTEAMAPYHKAMELLSGEVSKFGGTGTIHGCIVDISFFSHLYLNPFDGKVTAYWALDIMSRHVYDTIPALLQDQEPELCRKFSRALEKGQLPLLSQYADGTKATVAQRQTIAVVPRFVFGTEMYDPSRIMRAIQYVFDQNVIRIWKDEIVQSGIVGKNRENTKLLSE